MRILGTDPGKSGAVCLVCTETKKASLMRLSFDKQGDLDMRSLVNFVCRGLPDLIVLETPSVNANDQWGKSVIFSFGDVFGQVKAALRMADRPMRYLKPSQWQKKILEGIPKKLPPKERALIAYNQLYPRQPIPMKPRQKRPHDGEVDALLIATFGVLEYGGGQIHQWEF